MTKTRMLVVLGTRPEAIKLAPVVRALKSPCASATPDDSQADVVICSTGQHREMLASALGSFGLKADLDLALMRDNQDLVELLGRSLIGLRKVIADVQPDVVISQGDTTTAMASGLAAFFMGKRFAHVEAGLRTGNRQHPFPEEVNRRIAGVTADIHFAPTEAAASALLNEGVHSDSIFLTGNTVVDATQWALELSAGRPLPSELDPGDAPLLLVTAHRRENFGKPFEELCRGIQEIARRFPGSSRDLPGASQPQRARAGRENPRQQRPHHIGGATRLPFLLSAHEPCETHPLGLGRCARGSSGAW